MVGFPCDSDRGRHGIRGRECFLSLFFPCWYPNCVQHLIVVLLLVVLKVCRRQKEWFRATPSAVQLLNILNDLRVRKIDRWEPTTLERAKKVSVLLLRRYRKSGPEEAQIQEPQELYGRVVVSQHDTNGLAKFRTPVPVSQPRESSDV